MRYNYGTHIRKMHDDDVASAYIYIYVCKYEHIVHYKYMHTSQACRNYAQDRIGMVAETPPTPTIGRVPRRDNDDIMHMYITRNLIT